MKIFHLSHTDLDGYGAQFVLSHYFDNIVFVNSNYGKEIDEQFNKILSMLDKDDDNFLLITDLNLTLVQCEDFEKELKDKNCKILLLDHHQSGELCFKQFPWYFLDNSKCATKITYDFFSELYGKNEELENFVNVINAVDIWLSEDENFEFGKVCMSLLAGAKEINRILFEDKNHEYIFYLLRRAQTFYGKENSHILLDDESHAIKKSFLMQEKNDTLNNLLSTYLVKALGENLEKFTINYGTYKGILTYNMLNVSIIGNAFLVQNPDFDFFIDVSSRKTLSFRSNNKIDVSQMAKFLVSGGGHKNASGGLFTNFKDSFDYKKVKNQIQRLINSKFAEERENNS